MMAEQSQLDRLTRMLSGQQRVLAWIDQQREEMLSQIRETHRLKEIEEAKQL